MPLKLSIVSLLVLATTAHADDARTTVTTDPVALVYERYTLGLARAVSAHIALRADAAVTPPTASLPGPSQLSAGVAIYFERAFHGPFLELGALVQHAPVWGVGYLGGYPSEMETVTTVGPQVSIGWQVTLPRGFTLAAAIGAARTWATTNSWYAPVTTPTSSLRVGYAW